MSYMKSYKVLEMNMDHYPFGSPMLDRKYSPDVSRKYSYGLNTQQKDDEIFEGAYSAEYWEYDSRLGRRWNQDPKPTVDVSYYACFANNPITVTDVHGDVAGSGEANAPAISSNSPLKKKSNTPIGMFKNKYSLEDWKQQGGTKVFSTEKQWGYAPPKPSRLSFDEPSSLSSLEMTMGSFQISKHISVDIDAVSSLTRIKGNIQNGDGTHVHLGNGATLGAGGAQANFIYKPIPGFELFASTSLAVGGILSDYGWNASRGPAITEVSQFSNAMKTDPATGLERKEYTNWSQRGKGFSAVLNVGITFTPRLRNANAHEMLKISVSYMNAATGVSMNSYSDNGINYNGGTGFFLGTNRLNITAKFDMHPGW